MYFIDKSGIRQDVFEARENTTGLDAYAVVCSDCGNVEIVSEEDFIKMVEARVIDIFCDPVEDECDCDDCISCVAEEYEDECQCDYCQGIETDFEDDDDVLCQCDYCCGFRDGVEMAMDVAEELEAYEDECGCDTCREFDIDEEIMNDVKDSLLDIKSTMNELMEDGCYDEVAKLADVYAKLFNLIY